MTSAWREVLARLQRSLGHGAVGIDIFLARQLHDRIHDLIRDPSQYVAIIACCGVGAEVHRLADSDLRPSHHRDLKEPRSHQLGVDHGDRDYWHTRLQNQSSYAGLSLVKTAVWRAGAFRIDAEQISPTQYPQHTFHAGTAGPPTGAVHWELPDALEEPGQNSATQALTVEQFDLGRKGEPALDHGRQQECVACGDVIADQNRAAGLGDVLGSAH